MQGWTLLVASESTVRDSRGISDVGSAGERSNGFRRVALPTDRRWQSTPSGVAFLVDTWTAEVESVSFEQRVD